nr:MAG TPA: Tumor necrosis factor ligand superfamily receptor complex, IMMUNE RESPONSE.6A [Caudoviricetes sp.]
MITSFLFSYYIILSTIYQQYFDKLLIICYN